MLALVGEIIHGDPECWGLLLTKQHGKGTVQARFAKHLTQNDHPLTLNKKETSSETIASWIQRGLAAAKEESKHRGENAGRRSAEITDLTRTWYDLVVFYEQKSSELENRPHPSFAVICPSRSACVRTLQGNRLFCKSNRSRLK